jgi:hypothetical protein
MAGAAAELSVLLRAGDESRRKRRGSLLSSLAAGSKGEEGAEVKRGQFKLKKTICPHPSFFCGLEAGNGRVLGGEVAGEASL